MDKKSLLMIIVNRRREGDYRALLSEKGVFTVLSSPCHGTAAKSLLDIMGLETSDKSLLIAIAGRETAKKLLDEMVMTLGIRMPDGGIAFTAPVGSVGGKRAMSWLMSGSNDENSEVSNMCAQTAYPFDLIISIAQRDSSELVMDAARAVGASGGTIVHAKGTGGDYAAKFFGVTLAAEKELVLIVARHEKKDAIMKAIMENAGINTPARAVVFSVPVESVAGLSALTGD